MNDLAGMQLSDSGMDALWLGDMRVRACVCGVSVAHGCFGMAGMIRVRECVC